MSNYAVKPRKGSIEALVGSNADSQQLMHVNCDVVLWEEYQALSSLNADLVKLVEEAFIEGDGDLPNNTRHWWQQSDTFKKLRALTSPAPREQK
jgi:hypothetical protein